MMAPNVFVWSVVVGLSGVGVPVVWLVSPVPWFPFVSSVTRFFGVGVGRGSGRWSEVKC